MRRMSNIVFLSGSPSLSSKTESLLRMIENEFKTAGWKTAFYSVLDISVEDLLRGNVQSKDIKAVTQSLKKADIIVIGTPIYQSSFTGVLKSLLDLLPQNVLAGKTVLPIGMGGAIAHYLALDYSLTPILRSLGATNIVKAIFIVDKHVKKTEKGVSLSDKLTEERISRAVEELIFSK